MDFDELCKCGHSIYSHVIEETTHEDGDESIYIQECLEPDCECKSFESQKENNESNS